ncbi:hypothetical protein Q1695_002553 [Nippostrongylus brasiliensis]|nr:hypothetical protein Q1695_002553 [Nippostrongylus brasiliensis]
MRYIATILALTLSCSAAPLYHDGANETGLLIFPGSPDTYENRQLVKNILESLNIKMQNLHRASVGSGPATTPLPKPDLGPKNNYSLPISVTNKKVAPWLHEGDMALSPKQAKTIVSGKSGKSSTRDTRACITDPENFWDPLVPIPYTFDNSLASDVVALIRRGLQYWTQNTCMSFVENPNGMNHLRFYAGVGCWGYVGKQPTWPSQDISIGDGCNTLGTVTHEIAHALGFYHTQSRYDRDSWVHVDLANVDPTLLSNFAKLTPATETHFGQAYDYGSVMQYNPYAFAENPNQYTVTALDMSYQNSMGQREAPAFSDVRMMNRLYNCGSFCAGINPPSCSNFGYQDPRNCYSCKCPRAFGGAYCNQLAMGSAANCNGAIIQAYSTSWATLQGQAGDSNSYVPTQDPTDCFWHIQAPPGRRIQLRLSASPQVCMEGCPWQSVEINLGQFDLYGMLMCCPSSIGQTYTSTGSLVTIRGAVRVNELTFAVDYRVV